MEQNTHVPDRKRRGSYFHKYISKRIDIDIQKIFLHEIPKYFKVKRNILKKMSNQYFVLPTLFKVLNWTLSLKRNKIIDFFLFCLIIVLNR